MIPTIQGQNLGPNTRRNQPTQQPFWLLLAVPKNKHAMTFNNICIFSEWIFTHNKFHMFCVSMRHRQETLNHSVQLRWEPHPFTSKAVSKIYTTGDPKCMHCTMVNWLNVDKFGLLKLTKQHDRSIWGCQKPLRTHRTTRYASSGKLYSWRLSYSTRTPINVHSKMYTKLISRFHKAQNLVPDDTELYILVCSSIN